jgi:hypothetical protein
MSTEHVFTIEKSSGACHRADADGEKNTPEKNLTSVSLMKGTRTASFACHASPRRKSEGAQIPPVLKARSDPPNLTKFKLYHYPPPASLT